MGARNQTSKKNKIKITARPPSWNTEKQQNYTRKKKKTSIEPKSSYLGWGRGLGSRDWN